MNGVELAEKQKMRYGILGALLTGLLGAFSTVVQAQDGSSDPLPVGMGSAFAQTPAPDTPSFLADEVHDACPDPGSPATHKPCPAAVLRAVRNRVSGQHGQNNREQGLDYPSPGSHDARSNADCVMREVNSVRVESGLFLEANKAVLLR